MVTQEEKITSKAQRKEERRAKIAFEKKKIKDMKSFKDKKDYIWEYYKIHIISCVLFIIIVIYILNITVFNPPDKTAVGITITQSILSDTAIDTFKLNAKTAIALEDGYEVTITSMPLGSTQDIRYENAMQQKLMAMIVTGDIDLIIGVDDFFKQNSTQSMLFDIEKVLTDSKYDSLKDKFVMGLVPTEMLDTETIEKSEIVEIPDDFSDEINLYAERPIAVRLDNSKVLRDLGYPVERTAIGFIATSKKPDTKLEVFDYIMGIE